MSPTKFPLRRVFASWRPGSAEWDWDAEAADVDARLCLCCNQEGHYQTQLEAYVYEHGLAGFPPVVLGDDGRVWDGHHRLIAAHRLGIEFVPVEFGRTPAVEGVEPQ